MSITKLREQFLFLTDLDDKAAGRLSSTDLYHITTAALEGHDKQCLAYCALSNNYTSLIALPI
jgi:hypothetical protein